LSKKVSKRKASPTRSIEISGDDHEVGLWINTDLLRKHRNPTPQTIIHSLSPTANNRYLELADLALGNGKVKKKAKAANSNG
jgi:hypothetical protein